MLRKMSLLLFVFCLISLVTVDCFADIAAGLQQAKTYMKEGNYQQAESIYEAVATGYPGTDDALKARQKLIIIRILTKRRAWEDISQLVADFKGNPLLAEQLYWIARKYQRNVSKEKASQLFEQVITLSPDSTYARKSRLNLARLTIRKLVDSGQHTQLKAEINNLITNYSDLSNLPAMINMVAGRYDMQGKYDEAKEIFQILIEHFPATKQADRARLCIPRADIKQLIEQGQFSQAQTKMEQMVQDHSTNWWLASAVFTCGKQYEQYKQYGKAKELYEYVLDRFTSIPGHEVDTTQLNIRKCDILLSLDSADKNTVVASVNQLKSDFSSNKYLPTILSYGIAGACYDKGVELQGQGLTSQAQPFFEKALAIWQIVTNDFSGTSAAAQAYCRSGDAYRKLEDFSNAVASYQQVVNNYPSYDKRWHALFMVGKTYQKMQETGLVSKSQAEQNTRTAYQQLIESYPDCGAYKAVSSWLSAN